ncbi:MAG: aminopeptidase N [Paracoccaceae bacterium]
MTDQTIRLSDYQPLPYLIADVHLTFSLHATETRVKARIGFVINPARNGGDLRLDGQELELISAKIDGADVMVKPDAEGLTLPAAILSDRFIWECETVINPEANTSLDGLYMSGGMYCTQCEAEGFRKITFYPDRPDVMTVFTVRIESDMPVLLSNGNPVGSGVGWAEWHDPWPKPAYLFALVAGDLVSHDDTFTTVSGREVALKIYVRDGDQDKCAYAMDSLIRSMKWDEDEYGREYDLDIFNIVAVDDFNMGAMENKGLNVFNSALVLASPETATDANYENIESVVAHEYFHNWTGNRITCRDWFQLCLKEGLTVYRDQQFSSDMRDPSVKRINDARNLRAYQFREDAGPLAHPPRPEEYIEINNFYTSTVYRKGAEVVGMLRRLVGADGYRNALNLYFDRHDGQACTIEDWLTVFEDATGRDLTQFKLWYSSAGTPKVSVTDGWSDGVYSLTLTQKTAPTPGQDEKLPRLIPVAVGLLYPDGSEAMTTKILELDKESATFTFDNVRERPFPSILRDFSAPVILERDVSNEENAFLLANDTDPFNKWEAGRNYALNILGRLTAGTNDPDAAFLAAMKSVASDDALDPAFRALTLSLPDESVIAGDIVVKGGVPDPVAIHKARRMLDTALAGEMAGNLTALYATMNVDGAYTPDAKAAGKRALRSRALALMTLLDPEAKLAKQQFVDADNMTEQLSALNALVAAGQADEALKAFHEQWKHEKLVIDKWFMVQAVSTPPERVIEVVQTLSKHVDFEWKNPNRFRALIGAFASGNPAGFHDESGAGYTFVADWIITLDPHNPQTTANMCTVFSSMGQYDPERQAKMKVALQRVQNTEGLSKNASEIVGRILS